MKAFAPSVFIVPQRQLVFRLISVSNQALPSTVQNKGYLRAADMEIELREALGEFQFSQDALPLNKPRHVLYF